ncbi:uncharacterized protein Z520_01676 [Fonsecaea multimorphosa CBS 102226]|uniref:Uncharacterized protein n=1 Tax=Fonsecaea multimorphosa CBS 102226 TaxID=1442371 RepID=A0A0D2L2C9_9EURO|nr:uncharacterized protein Z520_01676 [Fonsecaea multimorphosa CBS 102226]KIY03209.1 hypothetical protein Z520_01676 [Fonsecaea multimorphosa CBS 102226]
MPRCLSVSENLQALELPPAERKQLKKDITAFWKSRLLSTDTTRVHKADILQVAQAFIDLKGATYFSAGNRTAQQNILRSVSGIIQAQRRNFIDNSSRGKPARRAMPQMRRPQNWAWENRAGADNALQNYVDLTEYEDGESVPPGRDSDSDYIEFLPEQHRQNLHAKRRKIKYNTRSNKQALEPQPIQDGGPTAPHPQEATSGELDGGLAAPRPQEPASGEVDVGHIAPHPQEAARSEPDGDALNHGQMIETGYREGRAHSTVPETIGSSDPEIEMKQSVSGAATFESFGRRWRCESTHLMAQAFTAFLFKLSEERKKYRDSNSESEDMDDRERFQDWKEPVLSFYYNVLIFGNIENALLHNGARASATDAPNEDHSATELTFLEWTWRFRSIEHKAECLQKVVEGIMKGVKLHLDNLRKNAKGNASREKQLSIMRSYHRYQFKVWLDEEFSKAGAMLELC